MGRRILGFQRIILLLSVFNEVVLHLVKVFFEVIVLRNCKHQVGYLKQISIRFDRLLLREGFYLFLLSIDAKRLLVL